VLVHRTRQSALRVAAGMDHIVEGPEQSSDEMTSSPDVGRLTIATVLRPGERLRVVKFVAYGWSSQRTRPALHDQVVAALAGARLSGWDGLLAEQRAYLDEFWAGADVEIDGDAADQIAARSRGTPRVANRILRRVRDVAEVRHEGVITTVVASEALELLEVDGYGLERTDRELLRAIVERFDGGPVGLSTLAVALGEEPDTVEDVYEPYLLQLGFIQRTPRGRVVTKLGREHLGATKAEEALF